MFHSNIDISNDNKELVILPTIDSKTGVRN
jgi:hypothetical protein